MSLIQDSKTAIFALSDLASGNPDPLSLIHVQADLVRLHAELGQEMALKFHGKERAYIARKIAHAQQYQQGRLPGEKRLTASDATEAATLAIGEEWNAEVDTSAEYEGYRTLLKSLQNTIDFGRTLISFYRSSESNQPNS